MADIETAKGFAGLDRLRSNVQIDIASARAAAQQNSGTSTLPTLASATLPAPPSEKPPAGGTEAPRSGSGIGLWVWFVAVLLVIAWLANGNRGPAIAPRATTASPRIEAVANSADFEESRPPVGTGLVLTGVQINYCIAEDLRLAGMREAARSNSAIEKFNAAVDDYNARCGSYQYYGDADATARRTVARFSDALQAEGAARLVTGSELQDAHKAEIYKYRDEKGVLHYTERKPTRGAFEVLTFRCPACEPGLPATSAGESANEPSSVALIIAESANVRAMPSVSAPVVSKLPALAVVTADSVAGDWVSVRFEKDGQQISGYVAKRLLDFGPAEQVRAKYCAPERPRSGAVLQQAQRGPHTIRVSAGSRDVVAKLKSPAGKTVASFYIRGGETASLDSVPDGTYRVLFASGSSYSQKCGEFLEGMHVQQDPKLATFQTTSDATNVYSSIAEYRLVEQANGNFRPQSTSVAAFRD